MSRLAPLKTSAPLTLVLMLAACGGNVVVDRAGSAGGAGGTTSTGTVTTTGTGITTGTVSPACTKHDDCLNGVCVFSTGTCAQPCDGSLCSSCGPGTVCSFCATSSCPDCDDCLGACLPTQAGQCDDDDPCAAGKVCIFQSNFCADTCMSDSDCGDFNFCAECVTGSCCGCENCVSACVGGE